MVEYMLTCSSINSQIISSEKRYVGLALTCGCGTYFPCPEKQMLAAFCCVLQYLLSRERGKKWFKTINILPSKLILLAPRVF